MDEQPKHNHLTRDIKQDGSCPACAALLARQHASLLAAEAGRRDGPDQVPAAGQEPGPREGDGPDPQHGGGAEPDL